jgi:pyrroloquinoline-quinone synthase
MKLSERLLEIISERAQLKHPFYRAWSEGRLDLDILRQYAGQYFTQVSAFPRFVSAVHSRCPDVAARKVLLENLVDEELHGTDHPSLWLQFARGLGASTDEVTGQAPLPETAEMVDSFYWLTSREWTTGLCALYAYEAQVPEVAKSKIEGLQRFYGINDAETLEFFTAHQKYDVHHSNAVADLINKFADPTAAEQATTEAADALCTFLDGMARQANIASC